MCESLKRCIDYFVSFTVVVVGFRQILYTAEEFAGSVGLEIVVLAGTLDKEVNLLLSTANRTATGTICTIPLTRSQFQHYM